MTETPVGPEPEIFATFEDLRLRATPSERAVLDSATEEEVLRAETLLRDASDLIRSRCHGVQTALPRVLTMVTCRVVLRALRTRLGGVSSDASSVMKTTGPFTTQTSWNAPSGELFITKQDREDIAGSVAGSGAFEVNLLGDRWRTRHG